MKKGDPEDEFMADVILATKWISERLEALAQEGKFPLELLPIHTTVLFNRNVATGRQKNSVVLIESTQGLSEEALMGLISHELAHMYFDLQGIEGEGDEFEMRVDGLASDWGFCRQIRTYFREHNDLGEKKGWVALTRTPPSCFDGQP